MSPSPPEPAVDPALLREAAQWLTHLHAGEPDSVDLEALRRWQNTSAQHARAWQRAEAFLGEMARLPAGVAKATLGRPAQLTRRGTLAKLACLPLLPAATWLGWQHLPWREWTADYCTATGEQRRITLADGTRVLLNTATTLDVRYSGEQRLLRLLAGEILVATAPDRPVGAAAARPFIVQTVEGRARAIGTRFSVRREPAPQGASGWHSHVAVFAGAVDIAAGTQTVRLAAGEQITYDMHGLGDRRTADEAIDAAWSTGMLMARQMRLADLVAQLDRYRPGTLQCHPDVAAWRVSGAFPLLDHDQSLRLLARTLPVRLRYRSPFTHRWALLEAAPSAATDS